MQSRVERLKNLIGDNEAVFISSYPNIFYYSGFTSVDAYLLIAHDTQYIVTDSRYIIQAGIEAPEFEIYDIKNGFENLFAKIPENVIGFEEENITVRQYHNLEKRLKSTQDFVEMQKLINSLRKVKDSEEIKKIADAERIGDEAFSYVLQKIHAGMTEREVALVLEFYMKAEGASALSFETIAASGVRSAMPHGAASDKVIENGDFLTLDFGCVFEGYCSDMTRTVVIGSASDRQKEIYSVVLKAQEAAISEIAAGKPCSHIDAVARRIIADAGYGKYFSHGLGHSVGIEIHESPSLSPKCAETLKNGHVITVEPGIYIEGFGGVRIEDLIVVEDGKARNLTASDKDLIII